MIPKNRDVALDILKGVGCLFMIVAHSGLKLGGYEKYLFWGGLAPVLFFAVSGVTASFQAARYPARQVLWTSAFVFLLGFSFNRITDPGFLQEVQFDIIQMIALGTLAVYLTERYFHPPDWLYLFLGLAAFGVKVGAEWLLSGRTIPGITGLLLPPGSFPVFPWLFLFFLGLFAYRARNLYNLLLGLACAAWFAVLVWQGFPLALKVKWDMPFGYFLLCCALLFLGFWLVRAIPTVLELRGWNLLTFLGRNSLLFLYVHFPLILFLKSFSLQRTVDVLREHPYLFWILILALTLLLMGILLWVARPAWIHKPFGYLATWLVLVLLVFGAGLFISNLDFVYWTEIGLGLIFSIFYPDLSSLIKRSSGPAGLEGRG